MAGTATESFVRRHQMLSLCFWITLLFSILFAMAAMDATGQCYCDPCSESSPAVTSGMSVVTAISAFLFIAQPCYGLYLLRIQCSELVTGVFLGCSTMTTASAFIEAIQWGSESVLATSIAIETELEVNSSGVVSFKALSILAWIVFILQFVGTYWCCKSRDALQEVPWAAAHDYTQLPTRTSTLNSVNKFTSYQQALDDEDTEASANGDPGASLAHYL